MSTTVLTIDVSHSPIRASVVTFNDGVGTLVEEIPIANLFDELVEKESAPSSDTTSEISTAEKIEDVDPLVELISKYEINSSIIIVPQPETISLSLSLPFKDAKSLRKVLELEIQDLIPFDTDDFLLQHKVLGLFENSHTDIFISGIPRSYMIKLLKACQRYKIEPVAVTTPASVLGTILENSETQSTSCTGVLYLNSHNAYLLTKYDGALRGEYLISQESDQEFSSQLKRAVADTERRYNKPFTELFFVGDSVTANEVEKRIGRTVTVAKINHSNSSQGLISSLAAQFGLESSSNKLLTNFRSQEFAYNPVIKEIKKGLFVSLPYFALIALSLLLASGILYASRNYAISKIKSEIASIISTNAPLIKIEGDPLLSVSGENMKLEQQLKELGSPAKLNPVDALVEITADFSGTGLQLRRVSIRGTRATLEGAAPDYSAVERTERLLKKRSDVYCRVKKDTGSASSTNVNANRSFTFDIQLCE